MSAMRRVLLICIALVGAATALASPGISIADLLEHVVIAHGPQAIQEPVQGERPAFLVS